MIQVVLKNGKYAIYNTKGGSIPPVVNSVTIPTTIVVNTPISVSYTVVGSPTTITRTWYRGATVISTSTTSDLYTPVQADAGNASNIKCIVTVTNSAGTSNADSNTVAQVLTARTSAFLTASAISDATIRGGLNTFDIGLIANSLDTKMKAVYPFVADGVDNNARALQHRWNFMDARDLNAAFRLSFSGTLVHSSTGINTNGTNGFYDTNFNCASNGSLNNQSAGVYIRTDLNGIGSSLDFGTEFTSGALLQIYTKVESGGVQYYLGRVNDNNGQLVTNTNSQGFYSISRSSNTTYLRQKNNSVSTITESSISLPTGNILGFKNLTTYTARQQAFAFIGDGLTNTEMTNYYTLVQGLQTTLGRQVGVPIVSDSDAQAFLNAADITSTTQANAVNTLVIGMKAQGLWTKMKAVYPLVGGTAFAHKFNLMNPLDTNAAFRLTFTGGWGHSSLGALPNGANTWANTNLVPSTVLSTNSHSIFFYTNTSNAPIAADPIDMGVINTATDRLYLFSRLDVGVGGAADGVTVTSPYTAPLGCFALITKQSATVTSLFKNATKIGTVNSGGTPPTTGFGMIFGNTLAGGPYGAGWSNNRFAMAGIADGLSDTESVNLYNLIQTFQTSLSRQINP